MKKILFIFVLLSIGISSSWAQNNLGLKGVVVDSEGNPLPGVRVKQVGKTNFTVSNLDGTFQIESRKPIKKLRLTNPGLKEEKVKASPDMTVKMKKATWWNEKPGNQFFIAPVMGHAIYNEVYNPAFGLMMGWGRSVGFYTKILHNYWGGDNNDFSFEPLGVRDNNGSEYYTHSIDTNIRYLDASCGIMFRLKSPIYFMFGVGYHRDTEFYSVNGYTFDKYRSYNHYSSDIYESVLVEYGLMMTFKWFFINGGVSFDTFNGEIMAHYGIGFIL